MRAVPLAALLVPAGPLLAQAGGGSSGFSGGGGGGGGGGFSGGGSSGGGSGEFSGAAFLIVVAIFVLFLGLQALVRFRLRRARRRAERARQARATEVRGAAIEAAEDDVAFSPDRLATAARELFVAVQDAWDDRDRDRLGELLGPDLLEEWRRRLDDFDRKGWHSRAEVLDDRPQAQLVAFVNRTDEHEDRATVFVRAEMLVEVVTRSGQRRYLAGHDGPHTTVEQYWTLGRRDGRWILLSIEEYDEGAHHLRSPLVISSAQDPELGDRTRTELATSDAVAHAAGLVSTAFADDAHAAALDLSLVDDRFSPAVLQIAARRVATAWTDAIDGPDAPLLRVADPGAADALLYGGSTDHAVRTVVRGVRIDGVTIDALDGKHDPPTMELVVAYAGAWYREDRATQAVVAGSRERTVTRTARWRLRLTDDAVEPWRLAAVLADD
ncbi:TIM44-like domain-containing protein [Patulibacter sp. S7RM1-6]